MTNAFNPLSMENLAHSIVTKMVEQSPIRLDALPPFAGAGIYALYYKGGHSAYRRPPAEAELPIYVGKAVPGGARRGPSAQASASVTSRALVKRLREHRASIAAASNLEVADFWARWLVVDEIWIPLGESALIREQRPVWNAMIDGFGNHTPGSKRSTGTRSLWDTIHPGRPWADGLHPNPESASAIEQRLQAHLSTRGGSEASNDQ